MVLQVLGIDVACADWSSNGSATISFDTESLTFESVVPGALAWPTEPLSPGRLADVIDCYMRQHQIAAVSLDGPQGWRDPTTAAGTPGVGRRCEYESQTQGKTGAYPNIYPSNQRKWIEFLIDVFAALLARRGVRLAEASGHHHQAPVDYVVLECNPLPLGHSSRLIPLPGKSRKLGYARGSAHPALVANGVTYIRDLGSMVSRSVGPLPGALRGRAARPRARNSAVHF